MSNEARCNKEDPSRCSPPSSAQLRQLDECGRKQFGQLTFWLALLVGALTVGLPALAIRLLLSLYAAGVLAFGLWAGWCMRVDSGAFRWRSEPPEEGEEEVKEQAPSREQGERREK